MSTNQPFSGLKIIEIAGVLAGPSVGMFFAELGAEVTKVENRENGGDVTRSWKLPQETGAVSAYFSAINYKKKYLSLDLKNIRERKELNTLLADADILLTNFKAGSAAKLNLDFDTLKIKFPKLIVGQISGFKSLPNRTAYDVVVQAETGFMHMNGSSTSGPIKMPVALMDVLAAHQLKEGLLVALIQRAKTEHGYFVETNLEQAGIASLVNQASNFLMQKHVAQPMGSAHPNIAPYGDYFACADKKNIVLAIGSDAHFAKLLKLLKADESDFFELKTNQQRVKNRDHLIACLAPLFKNVLRDDILNTCITHQIPAGAIRSIDEVFETTAAKALVRTENIEGTETKRVSSIAFQISN